MNEDRNRTVEKPAAGTEAPKPVKHPPRPVKGPVDYRALHEKIAKRFDKVLKRLAE